MEKRVRQLVESSKQVIQDASLDNGAIVAGNSDKDYYPNNVANYRYVWPRDAAYTIYAEKLLGMDNLEEDFIEWMHDRAEGFKDSGMVYHRYATNGPRDTDFGHQYQPDQAAAMLWAMLETNEDLTDKQAETVHLMADGLWSQWDGNSFHQETHDLWEERTAHPDNNENFTYSLGACAEALYRAAERMDEPKWHSTAEEMRKRLQEHAEHEDQYYYRSYGEISDESIDSAVLGLLWPFNVTENDERLQNSINKMENDLMTERGLMRYQGDMYDGVVHHTGYLSKGGGAWPLLTFWYVKVLSMRGNQEKAHEIFEKQLEQIEGEYIPEQLFADKRQGIQPLVWSHAMFVVAAEELGYL